jgi:uncharacterized protein YcbX
MTGAVMMADDAAVSGGTVDQLYRYPVKSMQGLAVEHVEVGLSGIDGDRSRALIDVASGRLMSAKRWSKLLLAAADDGGITFPDGTHRPYESDDMDRMLSTWLGREVALRQIDPELDLSYEMTFDPPNDDAELYEIPAPSGSFLDLAPVHLISQQTLHGGAAARPDLNWDVRRFRPNLVVDAVGTPSFGEDAWCGRQLQIGTAIVEALQPTVRCAMPLRAQPGLESQPALFHALDEIHANHLGIYLSVIKPGEIRIGDHIEVCS